MMMTAAGGLTRRNSMSTFPAELTGTWEIDAAHSLVGFAVKHLVVATTRGNFATFTGSAVIDAANPANSSATVEIDVASITTGDEGRDGHLKSADFFDVENFPKLSFKSTSAKLDGENLVLVGDLTIKDVTKSVEIAWEFGGIAKDPWGNTKAGFEGTATINRKDWGLTWNAPLETGGVLIADKIKLVLEIEAALKAEA
jgi:polyisoprenoid-binding protein YceI